jgi:hypothetical protein
MAEVVGHVGTLHAGGAIRLASSEDDVTRLCDPAISSVANMLLLRNMLSRKNTIGVKNLVFFIIENGG